MRCLLFLFVITVIASSVPAPLRGQADEENHQEALFVDLTEHKGWGPFLLREGYDPHYWSGTFTIAGQNYKVYQLLDPDQPRREQRFIFREEGSEVTFATVY